MVKNTLFYLAFMHNLTGADLARYLVNRFQGSPYPFKADFTLDGEGVVLDLTANRGRRAMVINPRIAQKKKKVAGGREEVQEVLELAVEADIPQVRQEELGNYLKRFLEDDRIFQRDGALYSPKRYEDLPRLRSILKRRLDCSRKVPVVACQIIDKKVNNETLQKAMMDYMVRPLLAFLYRI